jgi:transposase
MTSDTPHSERSKRCPICRVAMVGSRKQHGEGKLDYFECLRCGLVIDYAASKDSGKSREDP